MTNSTDICGGPFFEIGNSPFCPATGKLTRFCKGGSKPPPRAVTPAQAAETPGLVDQARDDDFKKEQERFARNKSVIGASSDASFGQRLKLGS